MRSYRTVLSGLIRSRDGVASVEFVIILPLLLLFLAVAIDFGRLFMDYHAISKSIRDATRYLTRVDGGPSGLNINCPSSDVDNSSDEVENAMRLAMTGRIAGNPATEPLIASWTASTLTPQATGILVTVDCLANPDAGVTYQGFYDGQANIPSIVLTADVPFQFGLAQIINIGPAFQFTISHKMIYVGN